MAEQLIQSPEVVPQVTHEFGLTMTPDDFMLGVYGVSGMFVLLALLNLRTIVKFGSNVIQRSNRGY